MPPAIYVSPRAREEAEASYRRLLDRWPVPHEARHVPTGHGDTFIVSSGDPSAPPLVLLHGAGTNSGSWIRDVGTWSARFRVHAVDVIGEPGFSTPVRPRLRSSAHATWLDDVMYALSLESAAFAGASLGGWLALDYAIRCPERVTALSLLSPPGIVRRNRAFEVQLAVLRMCGEWGAHRSLQLAAGPRGALVGASREMALALSRTVLPRRDSIPLRSDDELAGLPMPVQVILGADDLLLRPQQTRARLERCLPNARVTMLDGGGHLLPPHPGAIADFLLSAQSQADERRAS